MKNKKIFLLVLAIIATHSFAQNCNYKTINQNGVLLKQFNPMPIGGNSNLQIATSISNINGNNNLMLTFRFRDSKISISNKVKITFSNSQTLTMTATRQRNDYIGGSEITHLIFALNEEQENKLSQNSISSVTINGTNIISAKMNTTYISQNLNCLN